MIYLAIPYSHENHVVRNYRFNVANRVAAVLFSRGQHVFSPISHSHPIALEGDLPKDFGFWEEFCKKTMSMCDAVVVVISGGWEHSIGVGNEIRLARELGLEISFVDEKGTEVEYTGNLCEECRQFTNHIEGVCLKCLIREYS